MVLYGALGALQHMAFMVQFFQFERKNNVQFLLWILFPMVPYMLSEWMPVTMHLTTYFKPVSQVLSHIPQLLECKRVRTTAGVSMMSQHLNFVGGLMGIYMCIVIPPRSKMPWMLYINSVGQAVTLYMSWLVFDSGYWFPPAKAFLLPMSIDTDEKGEKIK